MRKRLDLPQWNFWKEDAPEGRYRVTVPHTWNALDGQDGGGDYWRGKGWYTCEFSASDLHGGQVYAVFEGANHAAQVWCNSQCAGTHKGGFSRFVLDISTLVKPGVNELCVMVDNSPGLPVYPQQADFTFFGGLYRPVYLLAFDGPHIAFGTHGGDGVYIDAKADGNVQLRMQVSGGSKLEASILDGDGKVAAVGRQAVTGAEVELHLCVQTPSLWDGLQNPHLYTCRLSLWDGTSLADELEVRFGFRSFGVDREKGFFLNGRPYPLRGVSRHQDRQDMGWAVGRQQHEEDIALIREIGANTVRLAHYQQAQEVYSLCDEQGLVVWAEIPFITAFDERPEAVKNTLGQLAELIEQCYNHPSICFWGVANELGISGESPAMLENIEALHGLACEMDAGRPTAIANLGATPPESRLCGITNLLGFNMYLGWYDGEAEDIGPFLDSLHRNFARPVALTEYGAEALPCWHSEAPQKRDYSEEYQLVVHEAALRALESRPFVWGAWVWNMFDFAADSRDEGGCKGRNNKGLVTFDRKTRKDAFYLYKAWWSDAPFVHITGRRFYQRRVGQIVVKVYSNCTEVTLLVNGHKVGTQQGSRVFLFPQVALQPGENIITATAGGQRDSIALLHTTNPTESYIAPQPEKQYGESVAQWFTGLQPQTRQLTRREGYLSVEDTMDTLLACPQAREAVQRFIAAPLKENDAALAQRMDSGGTMKMIAVWRHIQTKLPDEAILLLNEALNEIPRVANGK